MQTSPNLAPAEPAPFSRFYQPLGQSALRHVSSGAHRLPESDAVAALLPLARLDPAQTGQAQALAFALAQNLRQRTLRALGRCRDRWTGA